MTTTNDAPARVKQLEWVGDPLDDHAKTPFGRYRAEHSGYWSGPNHVDGDEDDMRSAKAAAQTDYEARILSALASDASPRGEAVAWAQEGYIAALTRYGSFPMRRAKDEGQGYVVPLYANPAPATVEMRRVRHLKRGSTYEVIGEGEVQISNGVRNGRWLSEGDTLIAYRAHSDGKLWLRFPDEFEDGRFEDAAALAPATEGRKG